MTENQIDDMVKKKLLKLGYTSYNIEASPGLSEEYSRCSSIQCQLRDIDKNLDTQKNKATHGKKKKKGLAEKKNLQNADLEEIFPLN